MKIARRPIKMVRAFMGKSKHKNWGPYRTPTIYPEGLIESRPLLFTYALLPPIILYTYDALYGLTLRLPQDLSLMP